MITIYCYFRVISEICKKNCCVISWAEMLTIGNYDVNHPCEEINLINSKLSPPLFKYYHIIRFFPPMVNAPDWFFHAMPLRVSEITLDKSVNLFSLFLDRSTINNIPPSPLPLPSFPHPFSGKKWTVFYVYTKKLEKKTKQGISLTYQCLIPKPSL